MIFDKKKDEPELFEPLRKAFEKSQAPRLCNVEFDCGCKFNRLFHDEWVSFKDESGWPHSETIKNASYSYWISICTKHSMILEGISIKEIVEYYLDKSPANKELPSLK